MSRHVYVIAGPNGAGKTTFANEFLPKYAECRKFINADLIAQDMSPFSPETAALRAGRLMLEEIEVSAMRSENFGFETTLSGLSYVSLIRGLKEREYEIHIFFLLVSTVDLALARVRRRVLEGGHNIPEFVVRRRFDRSLRNFFCRYRSLADSWALFDNSSEMPALIAFEEEYNLRIMKAGFYNTLMARYGKI